MKRLLSVLCTCCLCWLAAIALGATIAEAAPKVCICHVPPGNPDNAHTICVGAPAVRAHLRHGDTMGACRVTCGGDAGDTCGADQFCKRDDGVCSEDAEGICTDLLPAPCPTIVDPVCGCDGVTYNNACEANAAGVNVASEGACEGAACGGEAGDTCTDTQFCKTELGACDENAEGTCASIPVSCSTEVNPVCGCDGETYPNACTADGAGVNVASEGECAGGGGTACGGEAGDTCEDTEFCKLETGACSEDTEGVCTAIPGACPATFIPVCGCDGETYSNECFAASNGTSVAAAGACAEGVACVVGGGTCAEGEFCMPEVGSCEASAAGTCTPIPGLCPLTFIPVCGCDGVTYANPCSAFSAGVGIAAEGECEADQQACGGAAGTCPTGEVCIRPMGECAEDAEGLCHPTPVVCPASVIPVCGCDGITYSNACVALGAGVTVASEGECEAAEACGGASGGTCAEDQFCKLDEGVCAEDAEGVCTNIPAACPTTQDPVCGCDGVTYSNACVANGAGVNVASVGECGTSPGAACDGTTGVTCAESEFCKHADGACGVEVEGVCTVKPLTCEPVDNPVCACGEIGFPNVCYANAVGLSLENTGVCTP